jgi:hypothetical protein
MRSLWAASSHSSSATRWLVAGGERVISLGGEREREDDRLRPPAARLGGESRPSWAEGGSSSWANSDLVGASASAGAATRAAARTLLLGGADDDLAGAPEARRERPVEGETTPSASTCSEVSGRKADAGPGRGEPNKVRSLHCARAESLPGSRVSPLAIAASKARRRASGEAACHCRISVLRVRECAHPDHARANTVGPAQMQRVKYQPCSTQNALLDEHRSRQ